MRCRTGSTTGWRAAPDRSHRCGRRSDRYEILETEGSQTGDEGCLSLPGKAGQVTRPNYVKARAFDENLEEYEIEGEGLLARAICHELDHLDGHMYVEKVEGEIHDVQYADPEDEEDWEEIDEEA